MLHPFLKIFSCIRRDIAFDGRSSAVFPPDAIDWDNSLPTDDFDGGEVKIDVKLTTEAEEGLILFQGSQTDYFISLGGIELVAFICFLNFL